MQQKRNNIQLFILQWPSYLLLLNLFITLDLFVPLYTTQKF